jgi:hypothetical protein
VGREDDAGEGRGLRAELLAARGDSEYGAGRYVADRPLPFVDEIISTLRAHPVAMSGVGLYVGCGNGRNYLPLLDAGLDLQGIDVSREALDHLIARRATVTPRLACAESRELEIASRFDYLVAINCRACRRSVPSPGRVTRGRDHPNAAEDGPLVAVGGDLPEGLASQKLRPRRLTAWPRYRDRHDLS